MQNLSPDTLICPHRGHLVDDSSDTGAVATVGAKVCPHWVQKFLTLIFTVPQAGQLISTGAPLEINRQRLNKRLPLVPMAKPVEKYTVDRP